MNWKITYLDAANKYRQTDKTFTGATAYEDAVKWGRANIGNFHLDMVTAVTVTMPSRNKSIQYILPVRQGPQPVAIELDDFDLFEYLPELSDVDENVDVLLAYDFDNTYEQCQEMQELFEANGYTFDYYLDAEPYELRPLSPFSPSLPFLNALNCI